MRKALIVGIDDYPSAPLNGCVNDANKMEEVLKKHQDGSRNFDCKKLITPTRHITRSSLRRDVEELFAYQADIALFYFSGHGTENNLGGYLVTQEHEVVIILDCCYSGAFGRMPEIDNISMNLREGISVLTASSADQPSIETNGNGIFTKLVYEALQGGASDVLGHVTVASVYAYADQILGAWEQRPLLKSHVSKLLPLRFCSPQVDPSILRLLPNYFEAGDYIYPLDPSYEWDKHEAGSEYQADQNRI